MTSSVDFGDIKRRMDGAVNAFKHDIAALRTGRASANLLDPVHVEAYGSKVPLSQVGTITVPEPRLISVNIWDKALVSHADRAIREANLGFNPITDGTTLRIPLPELNEERRKELVKLAHQYAENSRIAARHVRRDGMEVLKKEEKDGDIGKDEHHELSDRVQKMTDSTIAEIDELLGHKEIEIMQV